MLILADRAEIFLNEYLINTRQDEYTGSYSCICRHSERGKLDIKKTHCTQDDALKHCKMAALMDSMRRSKTPEILVKVCAGNDKIVAANGLAEKLLGGKLIGHSYNWFLPIDREVLLRDGVCRSDVRCVDLDGRQMCLSVTEQLIKFAGALLILSTINPVTA